MYSVFRGLNLFSFESYVIIGCANNNNDNNNNNNNNLMESTLINTLKRN